LSSEHQLAIQITICHPSNNCHPERSEGSAFFQTDARRSYDADVSRPVSVLRLRVARQLGYKSVKYLSRITVTDSLKNLRNGLGSVHPDFGYSWYAGI
jgi:hypothetical protein